MSQKAIERKQLLVEELTKKIKESKSVVILDYLGLTVEEVTNLRVELLNNGCEMQVIKNNITRRAMAELGFEEMADHLVGPNAVAFSNVDSVSAAKVVYEFAKNHKKLEMKVGIVDEAFMNNAQMTTIATLPSRETLLTMFAGGLLQPIKEFAIGLSLHIENLEQNA
ncbi:MAG: 50S ribosomal protein L10 [Candidatus Izemoplasmataceae bacterium]|uniref:50S ribosomal protein L10 n=1 Tax=Liberiplasma polymorphum TaxID=3374570 RepID=UPI003773DB55